MRHVNEDASLAAQQAWLSEELVGKGGLVTGLTLVATTGSTNADLRQAALAGAEAGTVLVSGHQSSGRGRLDRVWEAPPDSSVAVSMVLRPHREVAGWSWIPLLTSAAVAGGLINAARVDATVKWPNDVLVGERKICGILSEYVETPIGAACVVGFGINLTMTEDQLPVPTATSLSIAGAGDVSRLVLLAAVFRRLEQLYTVWEDGDDDVVLEAYLRRCSTLGRHVQVTMSAGSALTGIAESLDASGRLIVRTPTGPVAVAAGDVVHATPR